jgi:hypothetical protein
VRIADKTNGFAQEFRLGAWSKNGERAPKKRKKVGR